MTTAAVVAAAIVLVLGLLWIGQRRLIYLPDPDLADPPPDVTVETARTSDGIEHRIWIVPAQGDPVARAVVFNGNAGNKGHRLPLARDLAAAGMEVVLFDYRGYGDTAGSPSENGLSRDAAAVVEVASDSDLPVVYFGESLGGAVATATARERPPAALVLRSPFSSLADVAGVHYPILPVGLLLRDRFEVEETIPEVDTHVLVIYGESDSIVPPELSRRVFEAAKDPKRLLELEDLNHNDPGLTSGTRLAEAVRDMVDTRTP